MAVDVETLGAAKSYTNKALEGIEFVAGKNCIISNITDIQGGHEVEFEWTADSWDSSAPYYIKTDGGYSTWNQTSALGFVPCFTLIADS